MSEMEFPHANNRRIPLVKFIAAWKVWVERNYQTSDWENFNMPCLHSAVCFEKQADSGNRIGLDMLCRLLVASSYRNTMQTTKRFIMCNSLYVLPTQTVNPHTCRSVKGVTLTKKAIEVWEHADKIVKHDYEAALLKALPVIEPQQQADTICYTTICKLSYDSAAPQEFQILTEDNRHDIIKKLVRWIHVDPFRSCYRKEPFGDQVIGWDKRLEKYFWPKPADGYNKTMLAVNSIVDKLRPFAEKLEHSRPLSETEKRELLGLAQQIFVWGDVKQNNPNQDQVIKVIVNSLKNREVHPDALMNSGWTKLAAFATSHLEEDAIRYPQVIWDSRVSTSIIHRLDRMNAQSLLVSTVFPNIGTVLGQGGTRPRLLKGNWPSGYQKWSAQFAGSQLVREMRDMLNSEDSYPAMSLANGKCGKWTIRGVEMVLFMDGY